MGTGISVLDDEKYQEGVFSGDNIKKGISNLKEGDLYFGVFDQNTGQ